MQWDAKDVVSSNTDTTKRFNTLERLGQQGVTYRQGDHVYIERVGTKLSVYKDSLGRTEQKQSLFGAVLHFDMPTNSSFTSATVVVSREPEAVFGIQQFSFPIHKLRRALATRKELEDEKEKAEQYLPRHVVVAVAGGQEEGPAVRPRVCRPDTAMTSTAKTPLNSTFVRLQNNTFKGTPRWVQT